MISFDGLNEMFFEGIHTYIPNLSTIIISTKQQMSDNFYKSLSSMKYLQNVFDRCNWKFKIFYYNKSLKNFQDKNRMKFLSTNCGKIKNNISKHNYKIFTC